MNRTFIIAEAGVNHNGSRAIAMRLVEIARDCGADAVKFQTFKTEKNISMSAEKADYQKENTGTSETQFQMVKKLELTIDDHIALIQYCNEKKLCFFQRPSI